MSRPVRIQRPVRYQRPDGSWENLPAYNPLSISCGLVLFSLVFFGLIYLALTYL